MRIYLQGLTMGLAYVAPIGLQNLFVINSALTQRRSRVYLTALLMTNRFCKPMGATYASPMVSPCK